MCLACTRSGLLIDFNENCVEGERLRVTHIAAIQIHKLEDSGAL